MTTFVPEFYGPQPLDLKTQITSTKGNALMFSSMLADTKYKHNARNFMDGQQEPQSSSSSTTSFTEKAFQPTEFRGLLCNLFFKFLNSTPGLMDQQKMEEPQVLCSTQPRHGVLE